MMVKYEDRELQPWDWDRKKGYDEYGDYGYKKTTKAQNILNVALDGLLFPAAGAVPGARMETAGRGGIPERIDDEFTLACGSHAEFLRPEFRVAAGGAGAGGEDDEPDTGVGAVAEEELVENAINTAGIMALCKANG